MRESKFTGDRLEAAAVGDHGRELLARAGRWCDARFDPEWALPWGLVPGDDERPERIHFVPQAAWYAFGLLARDGPGDRAKANDVLDALFALQYDDPTLDEGQPWHGTFSRFAESPQPGEGAVPFTHFDPNWRQFLGTTFLLILAAFEERLDSARIAAIEAALSLCVRGEPPERVHPSYTNIALMRAFLESEAGARLGEPAWVLRGEEMARAITSRFDRHGVFEEYNSATYYGVDLYALALWRRCASSALLREEGERLETQMWRDLSRWYHPGLRNLCGPYSRTYGMDMRHYVGMLGLWIAFGADLDPATVPLPAFEAGSDVAHGHDLFIAPVVAWLGASIPDDARARLVSLEAPRVLEQTLSTSMARVATGHLGRTFMIGGEACNADRSAFDQYVPATLHWQRPDGEVGWLFVRGPGPACARAERGALRVEWPAADDAGTAPLCITLCAPNLKRSDFAPNSWNLPGLTLEVVHDLSEPELELGPDRTRILFLRTASSQRGTLVLTPRG